MQLLCYASDLIFLRSGAANGMGWLRGQAGETS
jgi:hypothetical protein